MPPPETYRPMAFQDKSESQAIRGNLPVESYLALPKSPELDRVDPSFPGDDTRRAATALLSVERERHYVNVLSAFQHQAEP